jgi:hypothetical protein
MNVFKGNRKDAWRLSNTQGVKKVFEVAPR